MKLKKMMELELEISTINHASHYHKITYPYLSLKTLVCG